LNPKPLRHIDLHSDAGRLEGLYRQIDDPAAVAIVCHPLPTHGGTLHNKVVFRAAKGLEASNVATLRFNFRGAGASGGVHDGGEGEQRDFDAALKWVVKMHPHKPVLAGGFSFGSWVASRAACEEADVKALFLIGTPANKYDFGYLRACRKPKFFLHGSEDEFGSVDKLDRLVESCTDAESMIIEGADHFFANGVEVVEEAMREWSSRILEELAER